MFLDRADAGRQLAARLARYPRPDPVVLGLPRGGVPVAAQVARELGAELDVLVVHKLGDPANPELAIGAVGEGGVRLVDKALQQRLGIDDAALAAVVTEQEREIERRLTAYRGGRPRLDLAGRNVILVDDGLATGSTAAAAVQVARRLGAAHITVAVPVGAVESVGRLRREADDVVCLATPDPFFAVGEHYRSFRQVHDDEVVAVLREAAASPRGSGLAADVVVPADEQGLPGRLVVPDRARGVVVFAHGSGSSRASPRNVAVAAGLQAAGLGTLLFDLLTADEADDRTNVFDVDLLAGRLRAATAWLRQRDDVGRLPLGYFGASTGAAAALVADAQSPGDVSAIVSRGGRPDLAGDRLPAVTAPTLLIVGSRDTLVLDLNRQARARLRCPSRLEVVAGATHLFEEPGTLDHVARLAREWFTLHLR